MVQAYQLARIGSAQGLDPFDGVVVGHDLIFRVRRALFTERHGILRRRDLCGGQQGAGQSPDAPERQGLGPVN